MLLLNIINDLNYIISVVVLMPGLLKFIIIVQKVFFIHKQRLFTVNAGKCQFVWVQYVHAG